MDKMIKVAVVKSIVSGNNRQAYINEVDLQVGDAVLIGRTNDTLFGSFDVGRVEKIYEESELNFKIESNVVVKDVITKSSPIFKKLKQELRECEIKKEIQERMKQVDEEQKMKMYADSDETIAKLMAELKSLED